jgi:hypothetical protein
MEWLADPNVWIAFATLTLLELVLGIDNVIFISILSGKLPPDQQPRARYIGLSLALLIRIALLMSLSWVIGLTEPLFSLFGYGFAGKDLVLIKHPRNTWQPRRRGRARFKENLFRFCRRDHSDRLAGYRLFARFGHNCSGNDQHHIRTERYLDNDLRGNYFDRRHDDVRRADRGVCTAAPDNKNARALVPTFDRCDVGRRRLPSDNT